jgi:ferredoxin
VPENYPPAIVGKIIGKVTDQDAPNQKQLTKLNTFISEFNELISSYSQSKEVRKRKFRLGLINRLLPIVGRTRSRDVMGEKFVDETLCTECGVCQKGCPYEAITLNPKPQFDMKKCYGCWYCYNHCPQKAIFTNKLRGVAHYPKPNSQLQKKLKIL